MKEPTNDTTDEPERSSTEAPGRGPTALRVLRTHVGGIVLGFGILCGGVIGFLLADGRRARTPPDPETRTTTTPAVARISVERQIAARRLSAFAEMRFAPIDPPEIVLPGFVSAISLGPPYETIDSALFDAGNTRIRLARILPVGRQEVCIDTMGRRFACGLMGRAALQNLLARRNVTCLPLFLTRHMRVDHVDADCTIDGGDVAEHMVRVGFAFPSSLAGDRLTDVLGEARESRVGVWSGPYLSSDVDHAIEDSRAVDIASQRSASSEGRAVDAAAMDRPMLGSVTAPPPSGEVRKSGRRDETARPKALSAAPDQSRGRPVATAPSPPRPSEVERMPPTVKEVPRSGVVAGPILPPPEALARKLGIPASTTPSPTGDNGRGASDR